MMGAADKSARHRKPANVTLTGFLAIWDRQPTDNTAQLCPCSLYRTDSSRGSKLLQLHDFCFNSTRVLAISNTILTLALIYADRIAQVLSGTTDVSAAISLCGCEAFAACVILATKYLNDEERSVNSRWASILSRGQTAAGQSHPQQLLASGNLHILGATNANSLIYNALRQQQCYQIPYVSDNSSLAALQHTHHQQAQPWQANQSSAAPLRYVAQLEMRALQVLDYALYVEPELFASARVSVEADPLTVTWSMLMLEQAGHLPAGYTLAHAPASAIKPSAYANTATSTPGSESSSATSDDGEMGTSSTTVGFGAAAAATPSPLPQFYTPPTAFTTAPPQTFNPQQHVQHQQGIPASVYSSLPFASNTVANGAPGAGAYYAAAAAVTAAGPALFSAVNSDVWVMQQHAAQQSLYASSTQHNHHQQQGRSSVDYCAAAPTATNTLPALATLASAHSLPQVMEQQQQPALGPATTQSWRGADPVFTALTLLMLAHSSAHTPAVTTMASMPSFLPTTALTSTIPGFGVFGQNVNALNTAAASLHNAQRIQSLLQQQQQQQLQQQYATDGTGQQLSYPPGLNDINNYAHALSSVYDYGRNQAANVYASVSAHAPVMSSSLPAYIPPRGSVAEVISAMPTVGAIAHHEGAAPSTLWQPASMATLGGYSGNKNAHAVNMPLHSASYPSVPGLVYGLHPLSYAV